MNAQPMVIGFSYGGRIDDPGVSNRDLIVALIDRYGHMFGNRSLILQRELAASLRAIYRGSGNLIAEEIGPAKNGTYLDSHEVARRGVTRAHELGASDVYVLAYPFLHRPACLHIVRQLAQPLGMRAEALATGWIRSDPRSIQWWTRNPALLPLYAAKSIILGTRGT